MQQKKVIGSCRPHVEFKYVIVQENVFVQRKYIYSKILIFIKKYQQLIP